MQLLMRDGGGQLGTAKKRRICASASIHPHSSKCGRLFLTGRFLVPFPFGLLPFGLLPLGRLPLGARPLGEPLFGELPPLGFLLLFLRFFFGFHSSSSRLTSLEESVFFLPKEPMTTLTSGAIWDTLDTIFWAFVIGAENSVQAADPVHKALDIRELVEREQTALARTCFPRCRVGRYQRGIQRLQRPDFRSGAGQLGGRSRGEQ